jgi:hypothetical protein
MTSEEGEEGGTLLSGRLLAWHAGFDTQQCRGAGESWTGIQMIYCTKVMMMGSVLVLGRIPLCHRARGRCVLFHRFLPG